MASLVARAGRVRGLLEGRTKPRTDLGALAPLLVVGAIAFLVLYPLWLLLLNSFQVGQIGASTAWGLDNWRTAITETHSRDALINTVTLSVTRLAIALALAVAFAWLIARTNMPGRGWLEFGFWTALFLPALPVLLGWTLLLDRRDGLVNQWLIEYVPVISGPIFNIYSWWGIVFGTLVIGTLPMMVFLLTPAFRNLNAALAEASYASGATRLMTFARIMVPIMLPAILVVTLLGMVRSMQSFEIELILGARQGIDVLTTLLYREVQSTVPAYGAGSAFAVILVALIVPFVLAQQLVSRRRSYNAGPDGATPGLVDLGKWKWPAFGITLGAVLVVTLVPIAMLVLGSFMRIFGYWDLPDPYTMRHWSAVVSNPDVGAAFGNTMALGAGAALGGMLLYSLLAYISLRSQSTARSSLDTLTWVPAAIPGVVLGLGLVWLFRDTPFFSSFQGTTIVLIAAVLLGNLTVGVQIIRTSMMRLGAELEEASWASGAGRIYTLQRVVLPLIAPALIVVALQVFATATAVVGVLALLGTPGNQPLSLLQLSYMEAGNLEAGSVVGVIMLVIGVGAALAARSLGLRLGHGRGG